MHHYSVQIHPVVEDRIVTDQVIMTFRMVAYKRPPRKAIAQLIAQENAEQQLLQPDTPYAARVFGHFNGRLQELPKRHQLRFKLGESTAPVGLMPSYA